jgi:hypothetical protein
MNDNELLYDLYYNKKNYDGLNELYRKAKLINNKIKKETVKEWLNKQQTHQMNKTRIKKKEYLPIYSDTPFSFQLDLTFFPRYKTRNRGYEVLFTAININTRFGYAYYAKHKDSKTILNLFKKLMSETEINAITTDEGSEYKNKEFIKLCDENDIKIYFVKDDSHKLGIINRWHRTIKNKLTKHFDATDSVNWVDVIDDIVNNYNNSINRGIGIEPIKVNDMIENIIRDKAKEKTNEIEEKEVKISINDYCRVKLKDKLFKDKMTSKYSSKIYKIIKIGKTSINIVDDNNIEYKAKKSDIIIVEKPEKILKLTKQKEANTEHIINKNIKKSGVSNNNIINEGTKRTRKPKEILNL